LAESEGKDLILINYKRPFISIYNWQKVFCIDVLPFLKKKSKNKYINM
jgi:hypothetical protein